MIYTFKLAGNRFGFASSGMNNNGFSKVHVVYISNNKKPLLYCRLVASFLLLIYLMYSRMGIHHFCSFFKENEVCHICRKEFEACEEQYPCRICDKVFHKDCVLSLKELHPSHLTAIKRANTSVGWSCPECVRFFIERAHAPDVMYLSRSY